MALPWEKSVLVSQTSPAFLHANSTSHTWVFSAIAEIIDNAYDPDVSASKLNIEHEIRKSKTCLVFKDNGNGMNADKLHKMLSFGYCEKVEIQGHRPVGHYGNGFKSGSMRLGKDAIVFTKHTETMSCGFLSQNFLKKIKAETVLVPILTFDLKTKKIVKRHDTEGSLKAVTQYSLFHSEEELLKEFEDIETPTGTKIIISDLKRGNDDKLELDFESSPNDIRNPEHQELDVSTSHRPVRDYIPEYRRSLREYCSILFLKPRMKIVIRNIKVQTKLVSKSLSRTEKDVYKPMWQTKPIKIIFGFGPSREDYGIMMYHRNRLIKAYEKVGCQKQADERGLGVVGVVSVDFLEPIHNKQDFNKNDRYNACMNALGYKLIDYWTEKTTTPVTIGDVTIIEPTSNGLPDWTWVQCDNCLKWRRLPDGIENTNLPEKWFCYMNPDPVHSRCDMDEEPEDEDELLMRATYQKTHKQQLIREKNQKKITLTAKEKELKRKEEELQKTEQRLQLQQLRQPLSNSPGESKPTIADLEKAKKDLEQSKRREEQQRRQFMLKIQEQNYEMEKTKRKLQNTMKKNLSSLQEQASGAGSLKKRNSTSLSNDAGPSCSKKSRTALATNDFVVTRNASSSDEEEPRNSSPLNSGSGEGDDDDDVILIESDSWKQQKKGKLPKVTLGKTITNSTVDGNDEDVKPDLERLDCIVKLEKTTENNNSTKECSSTAQHKNNDKQKCSSKSDSISKSPKLNTGNSSGNINSKSKPQRSNSQETCSPSVKNNQERPLKPKPSKTEVLLQKELEECKKNLSALRNNVRDLLKVIVPDLEINNLSYIDDIVVEMIKVNSQENGEEEQ